MSAPFVTGQTQPFIGDLLQALGLDHLKGIMGLSIVVVPDAVVRVEVSMAVTTEQADALQAVLRNRSYVLMEVLDDAAPDEAEAEEAADPEPIAT